jgi:MinD superfamily P-loop ATPase
VAWAAVVVAAWAAVAVAVWAAVAAAAWVAAAVAAWAAVAAVAWVVAVVAAEDDILGPEDYGAGQRKRRMIVAVASGKGGTGKTLVATSLALSLEGERPVQLLDCDVEEPNAHILLRPTITSSRPVLVPIPAVDRERCTYCRVCSEACAYKAIAVMGKNVLVFPELCHGCGLCSYLCPEKAISEEGREVGVIEEGHTGGLQFLHGRLAIGEAMAGPVIRAVKERADRSSTVIIDVPPGNSCPVVEAVRGSDLCLLVTEPTPFGLHDLALAVELATKLKVPCGVIINRDGSGDQGVERYCAQQHIPVLLKIPLDRRIAELYCRGQTLVAGMPSWRKAFRDLLESSQRLAVVER